MATDNDFIVAIELGSSKIAAIAGKKKDGNLQILSYAEVKSAGCIRRGMVYNIEKTQQCINTVVTKIEQALKVKVIHAYVGISGQSLRSYKCIVKSNLLTQSYITAETIDRMCRDSLKIPFSDYEVLENFPQEYKVDSSTPLADPVGVLGVNIEGEFLNIIAKQQLKTNIETVFANANILIADKFISPLCMADCVLTDAEKRSGCALIDLGADTTTLVIYKLNVVRYLVTIPLGCNNINKDLATLPIDEAETEDVKLKFGDACAQDNINADDDAVEKTYTTTDGRQIDVATIKSAIEARTTEIISNVRAQLVASGFNTNDLLSGIVLTGGGSNMKNIVEAYKKILKIDKVRIAKKVNVAVTKASNVGLTIDNGQCNTLISLMLGGTMSCCGEAFDNSNMFQKQQKDEEAQAALAAAAALKAKEEAECKAIQEACDEIRKACDKVKSQIAELEKYGNSKTVRKKAAQLAMTIYDEAVDQKYEDAAAAIERSGRNPQLLTQGAALIKTLEEEINKLTTLVREKNKRYSIFGRIKTTIEDITNDD